MVLTLDMKNLPFDSDDLQPMTEVLPSCQLGSTSHNFSRITFSSVLRESDCLVPCFELKFLDHGVWSTFVKCSKGQFVLISFYPIFRQTANTTFDKESTYVSH